VSWTLTTTARACVPSARIFFFFPPNMIELPLS
jgi:hypothetical protein